jgi:hypothetical protein
MMIENAVLKLCLEYNRKAGKQPPWFFVSNCDYIWAQSLLEFAVTQGWVEPAISVSYPAVL